VSPFGFIETISVFLWKHDLFHGPKKVMENMVIVNINYAQMTSSGNVCGRNGCAPIPRVKKSNVRFFWVHVSAGLEFTIDVTISLQHWGFSWMCFIEENMVIVNINYAQMTSSGNVCDFCGGLVCEVHIIAHHTPNSHENSFSTHSIWKFDSFIFVALRFVCLHIPKDQCAARTRNNVINTYYSEQIWTSMI